MIKRAVSQPGRGAGKEMEAALTDGWREVESEWESAYPKKKAVKFAFDS